MNMRALAFVLLFIAAPAWAQSNLATSVQAEVSAAAGCTIDGVAIVDPDMPASWRIDFDPSCTAPQIAAGQAAARTFNVATAAQAAQLPTILAQGVAITSTATSALNGTYAVDPAAQANISAIASGVANGEGLPGGGSTFAYLDMSGVPHSFTSAQFLTFGVAVRNYVYVVDMTAAELSAGEAESWPANTATIP